MNRNPEIIKETIFYAAATLVIAITAMFFKPICAIFVFLTGMALTSIHYYFSQKRYKRIEKLSESLNRILLGYESILIEECNEGELAILHSEVHKMTVRLKEQTDLLAEDKRNLTAAIEDIFHQLRTPLTAMNLTISLLYEENISYERRIYLTHNLKRQTERISWLVDSLLKMSKIDSGTAVFQKNTVFVGELIRKASEPFLVQMELKGITLKTELHDESFQGDLQWSVEAIGNLLKNAMEHTSNGRTVCVSAEETSLYTEICVSDNGEGFDPEDIPHLFERFYKGKNASQGSIGIGLALSRSIIAAQNGTISADNNAEGGAKIIAKFYKSVV